MRVALDQRELSSAHVKKLKHPYPSLVQGENSYQVGFKNPREWLIAGRKLSR